MRIISAVFREIRDDHQTAEENMYKDVVTATVYKTFCTENPKELSKIVNVEGMPIIAPNSK